MEHARVRIRGLEMFVFQKVLHTYLMDDSFKFSKTAIGFSSKFQVTFQDHASKVTSAWIDASTDFQIL